MGRKRDDQRLDEILAAIQANPDTKAGSIATIVGIDDKTVQRALVQLADRGDLLAEDDHGHVAWFGKRR
jgi:predicted ArsR family transcriptional regulator